MFKISFSINQARWFLQPEMFNHQTDFFQHQGQKRTEVSQNLTKINIENHQYQPIHSLSSKFRVSLINVTFSKTKRMSSLY